MTTTNGTVRRCGIAAEKALRYLDSEIETLTYKIKEFAEELAENPTQARYKMRWLDTTLSQSVKLDLCLSIRAHMDVVPLSVVLEGLKQEFMQKAQSNANYSTSACSNLVDQQTVVDMARMIERIESWIKIEEEESNPSNRKE